MTNEQAVYLLEKYVYKWSLDWDEREDELCYCDAIQMAIDALKEIDVMQAIHNTQTISTHLNEPLTLDELREMDLQEWLWIEVLVTTAFRRVKSGYYQVLEDYSKGEALCCGWPGTIYEFEYADYGKTWLAYRRKLEERTEEHCAICAATGLPCSMCQPGPCESRRDDAI